MFQCYWDTSGLRLDLPRLCLISLQLSQLALHPGEPCLSSNDFIEIEGFTFSLSKEIMHLEDTRNSGIMKTIYMKNIDVNCAVERHRPPSWPFGIGLIHDTSRFPAIVMIPTIQNTLG